MGLAEGGASADQGVWRPQQQLELPQKDGTEMAGGKQCGPLCISQLGAAYVDPGTLARTRTPLPGSLGIQRKNWTEDLQTSGVSGRTGPVIQAPLPPLPPLPPPDVRRRKYVFPVQGPCKFSDTWGEARKGKRPHRGVDIFAAEGTDVVALADGYITLIANWEGAGLTVRLAAFDNYGYEFMHLQSIDDAIIKAFGGVSDSFYDEPRPSQRKPGQMRAEAGKTKIGKVGCTGFKAKSPTSAHLHLQAFPDHRFLLNKKKGIDERINPYEFVRQLPTVVEDG
jgi:murein DD-endopeptidase MepM/ murein hydrolase activator NlpD